MSCVVQKFLRKIQILFEGSKFFTHFWIKHIQAYLTLGQISTLEFRSIYLKLYWFSWQKRVSNCIVQISERLPLKNLCHKKWPIACSITMSRHLRQISYFYALLLITRYLGGDNFWTQQAWLHSELILHWIWFVRLPGDRHSMVELFIFP